MTRFAAAFLLAWGLLTTVAVALFKDMFLGLLANSLAVLTGTIEATTAISLVVYTALVIASFFIVLLAFFLGYQWRDARGRYNAEVLWQIQLPIEKTAYLSLHEAVVQAYERTQDTPFARFAEAVARKEGSDIFSWYAASLTEFDHLTLPLRGRKPPSRISCDIPIPEIGEFDFTDEARSLTVRGEERPRYVDIEISEFDLLDWLRCTGFSSMRVPNRRFPVPYQVEAAERERFRDLFIRR